MLKPDEKDIRENNRIFPEVIEIIKSFTRAAKAIRFVCITMLLVAIILPLFSNDAAKDYSVWDIFFRVVIVGVIASILSGTSRAQHTKRFNNLTEDRFDILNFGLLNVHLNPYWLTDEAPLDPAIQENLLDISNLVRLEGSTGQLSAIEYKAAKKNNRLPKVSQFIPLNSERNLPDEIRNIIRDHQARVEDNNICESCNSYCCVISGFAILENVQMIYEKYLNGELVREDYKFPEGLTFSEFTEKYFDIHHITGGIESCVQFYPKLLTNSGDLISFNDVPEMNYFRIVLYDNNPWLSHGCIFLNKVYPGFEADDNDSTRKCMLHNPDMYDRLSAKPIDCLFHVCKEQKKMIIPKPEVSSQWMNAIMRHYPFSYVRYRELVERDEKM